MKFKNMLFSILIMGIVCLFPTFVSANTIFVIPEQMIQKPSLPSDLILSILDDYDTEEEEIYEQNRKKESHDPFAFPLQVETGIRLYMEGVKKEIEEKERKQEILELTKQKFVKEKEEKLRIAQKQRRLLEQKNNVDILVSEEVIPVSADELYPIVEEFAQQYGVPIVWILGVIEQESGFNPRATNKNTNGTMDRGLMQLNSNTAPTLAKRLGIPYQDGMEFDPRLNIEMGTVYLSYLYKKSDNPHFIFTSYNRGEGGAKKLFNRTGSYQSSYSQKIMERIQKYTKNP